MGDRPGIGAPGPCRAMNARSVSLAGPYSKTVRGCFPYTPCAPGARAIASCSGPATTERPGVSMRRCRVSAANGPWWRRSRTVSWAISARRVTGTRLPLSVPTTRTGSTPWKSGPKTAARPGPARSRRHSRAIRTTCSNCVTDVFYVPTAIAAPQWVYGL